MSVRKIFLYAWIVVRRLYSVNPSPGAAFLVDSVGCRMETVGNCTGSALPLRWVMAGEGWGVAGLAGVGLLILLLTLALLTKARHTRPAFRNLPLPLQLLQPGLAACFTLSLLLPAGLPLVRLLARLGSVPRAPPHSVTPFLPRFGWAALCHHQMTLRQLGGREAVLHIGAQAFIR